MTDDPFYNPETDVRLENGNVRPKPAQKRYPLFDTPTLQQAIRGWTRKAITRPQMAAEAQRNIDLARGELEARSKDKKSRRRAA